MTELRVLIVALALAGAACGGCGPDGDGGDTGVSDSGSDMGDAARGDVARPSDMRSNDAEAGDAGDLGDAGSTGIVGSEQPTPLQVGVSPDGVADLTPQPGAARAARFLASDTGFHGLWAHCKEGDIKLFNGELEACISGVRSNRMEMFAGGGIVDLRPTGQVGEDIFDIFLPRIGFNVPHAEEVRVIRDGTDGGPAVVRVTGPDRPIAYLVGVVGENLWKINGFETVVEYRLGPTDDFIEVATFVTNPNENAKSAARGEFFAMGDRTREWWPASGFERSGARYDRMFAMGEDYAFGFVSFGGGVVNGFGILETPWQITTLDQPMIEPDATVVRRSRLLVAPTLDHAITRGAEELGLPIGTTRTITIETDAGEPVAGRTVEVFADDGPVTAGVTDAEGKVVLTVPDGTNRVVVSGVLGGGGLDQEVDLSADISVVVPTPSFIELHVDDGVDDLIAAASIEGFGEQHRLAVPIGGATVDVMPGDWTVSVGRGPEWDGVVLPVTVGATGSVVDVSLAPVLDTTDWVAGDFHQHMEPSPDSTVRVEDRILANVAVGLELLTPTDHDVVTDLAPYIADLGLTDTISTFPGVEISPTVAHINMYPMDWDYEAPGRGTIWLAELDGTDFRQRSIPEVIAMARALPSDPVIQLNHPRGSGFLEYTDFDPVAGPDANEHRAWTSDFDAIEILNDNECQVIKDWAGLWNAGLTPTAIASSDVHSGWGGIGQVRSWLHAPGVVSSQITPEVVADAIRNHRVVAASHAFIEFTNDTLPGDTIVTDSGVAVQFPLRVTSPPWARVEKIQVISNGAVIATLTITPQSSTVDWDDALNLSFTRDAWVSFVASGPAPDGLFRPGGERTFALMNPVFVDVGGDGFTPPGPGPLDLDSTPYCP